MMQAQNGTPPKPEGYSLQSFFRRCVWEALWGGKFPFADTNTVKFSWNGSSYQAEAAPPGRGGGVSGVHWQSPRELDPSVAVEQDTLVYISPNNPICTVGLTDLALGVNTKATAGIWLALQAVPAKSGSSYRVPQDPIPSNGGAVAGSPLSGDADSTSAYWILIKPVC